jgi:hypothetical protein
MQRRSSRAISSLDQTGVDGRGAIVVTFVGLWQLGWRMSPGCADMAQEQVGDAGGAVL